MNESTFFFVIGGLYLLGGVGCWVYVLWHRMVESRSEASFSPSARRDPFALAALLIWPVWFWYWRTEQKERKERERDLLQFYRRDTEAYPSEPERSDGD
jgi:hypothetical protein